METGEPKFSIEKFDKGALEPLSKIILKVEAPDQSDLEKISRFKEYESHNNSEHKDRELIVASYLEYPKIFDRFEDHKKRRIFRELLYKSDINLYNYYEKNKLKGNVISQVLLSAQFLEINKLLNENEINKSNDLLDRMQSYHNFTIEEKLILVEEVSNFCRDFIDYRLAVDTEYESV